MMSSECSSHPSPSVSTVEAVSEHHPTSRRTRYSGRGEDRHPPLAPSLLLTRPTSRPGRILSRKQTDPNADITYGDAIIYKDPGTVRFLFQNVKGLTHSASGDDYNYYMSCMASYDVDCFGMAETNTGWQHHHLQNDFRANVRSRFQCGKTVFGFPTQEVDPCFHSDTYQAGGCLQVVQGRLTTTVSGKEIIDPTGLGRWCGLWRVQHKQSSA